MVWLYNNRKMFFVEMVFRKFYISEMPNLFSVVSQIWVTINFSVILHVGDDGDNAEKCIGVDL